MHLCSRARTRDARYSVEQVLRGIQAFVAENCGEHVVINADASVYDYAEAARKSHECPLEFLWDLASYFMLQWREERWLIWLKLRDDSVNTKRQREEAWERWERERAPTLTVRRLAEYIARHAPAISFEPITVFGRKCLAAGVFEGLCGCPEVKAKRVGPSTPLRELGSSTRICKLWTRAEWANGVSLPRARRLRLWEPRSFVQHLRMLALGLSSFAVFMVTVFVIASMGSLSPDSISKGHFLFGAAVSATVSGLALFGISAVMERMHNPLPVGVRTFGDLAKLIAKQRANV